MKAVKLYDENLKQDILDLKPTVEFEEGILIPESDYGLAEIYKIHDDILVFMIPQYGGTPLFFKCYQKHSIDNLISDLRTIT